MKKAVLHTLLLLLHTTLSAQQQEPIFKTKEDSARYAEINGIILEQVRNNARRANPSSTETTVKAPPIKNEIKLDSLYGILMEIRKHSLIGWRYRYVPNIAFTSYQDLAEGKIEPEKVHKLSLADYKEKKLPDKIFECPQLEELELVNTSVKRLPKKLNKLTRLREIHVYNNKPAGRLALAKNRTVTFLKLRGEKPEKLPRHYRKFKALDSLDLARNLLSEFPDIRKTNLQKLTLSENNLTLENLKVKDNNTLQVLALRYNKIKIVPNSISNFKALRKLNLQYNQIENIEPGIGELQKLEEISLYQNNLTFIPKSIYTLTGLREIDLYYNNIEKVDEEISQLKNLRVLYLSNNKLQILPESVGRLDNLRELYIHHNRLSYLPESISNLKNLKVLRFNHNEFVSFPYPILKLMHLENLDLSYNNFAQLPKEFTNYTNLKILALMSNPWENKDVVIDIANKLRSQGTIVHLNTLTEVVEDN